MAKTNITNIGTSQTISDINPIIKIENLSKVKSTASNIALGILVSAATISPLVTVSDVIPNSNSIESVSYAKVITPTDILPFRLTITNIGIEGYSQNNIPGIGIQVIGFSNYIL